MDERKLRNLACTGKHKHKTFAAALAQVAAGKKRPESCRKKQRLSAYKCQFCDGYHVGHDRHKGVKKY